MNSDLPPINIKSGEPGWHGVPFWLWRFGVREVNRLALDLVTAGYADNTAEPLWRAVLTGRAIGLGVEMPDRILDKDPDKAVTAVWKNYSLRHWVSDMTELFAELDVPSSHPCREVYDFVFGSLTSLRARAAVRETTGRLVEIILRDRELIGALHEQMPPMCVSSVTAVEARNRIQPLSLFVGYVLQRLPPEDETFRDRAGRLSWLLRLAQKCCDAVDGGWAGSGDCLRRRIRDFYSLDDSGARMVLRDLLECALLAEKHDLLIALSEIGPAASDRAYFTTAFSEGLLTALGLLLKHWPDDESRELLQNVLQEGLRAPTDQLVVIDPERSKLHLTPSGREVSNAISLARHHLPDESLVPCFLSYLAKPDIGPLQYTVVEELGEIGGNQAGAVLAEMAKTATGCLLTCVAEAIEKAATPEALDALLSRLPDRSLRLDRLPVIETLARLRPDHQLRLALLELLREPGCRCGGCVWRRAMSKLASLWPDAASREVIEDLLEREPGYEGRHSAARALAGNWPDGRTVKLLKKASRKGVTGSGEGELGHLPFDGLEEMAPDEKQEKSALFSEKLQAALAREIEQILDPTDEAEKSRRMDDFISRLLMQAAARRPGD